MTRLKKAMALGAMCLALMWTAGRAGAQTNPAVLSIDVTVVTALSVTVDGQVSSTRTAATVTPGGSPVVNTLSTVTVRSDATGINEYWKLNSSNAPKESDGTLAWTLATSTDGASGPDTDKFAMQALFISSRAIATSCPGVSDDAWNVDVAAPLTTAMQTYTEGTTGKFADQSVVLEGANGDPDSTGGTDGLMFPTSQRGFCYRIVPPTDVTVTDDMRMYVVVTAATTP